MRILHLSDFSLSGAPYRLSQVQRLGDLDSRLITYDNHEKCGGWRGFPGDLSAGDDPELLENLFRKADVIHYHNFWKESRVLAHLPWAWEIVRKKPSVIQFHSWTRHQFEEQLREPGLVKLVCAQYQVRLYPECIPVPLAIPIDDALHRPANIHNDPPIIVYTPSEMVRKGWNDKGYAETVPTLARGFRYELAFDRKWEDVMKLRRQCDIAIDEVMTGSYHTCSLEALSQGLATIAGLDSQTVDALESVTGTRRHPWIVARPDTLHQTLTELVHDHDYRIEKRREARAYMERYWNTAAVNQRFREAYQLALVQGAPSAAGLMLP